MNSDAKSFANPRTAVALGCLSPGKQVQYTCICCRTKFDSVELQRGHFKTEWHVYNLKRKVCNLEPIDLDAFNQIKAAQSHPLAPEQVSAAKIAADDIGANVDQCDSDEHTTLDEDEWERIDSEEFIDEDYSDEEAEEMLARVIKSDTCLFCDHKSCSTESNVEHMNVMHGFFIPEEQYLIDIDGMLEYLGFKVGAGATCLWCDKQFTTLHGVRLHMLYKDHCKIYYNQEQAPEFKEFYDYSEQEHIPMKPLNELVIVKQKRSRAAKFSATQDKFSTNRDRKCASRQQLVKAGGPSKDICSTSSRGIKKFNSRRAKILLKTQLNSNMTVRGRLRNQNPI